MLVVKYDRTDFFGQYIYTEDKKETETLKDIKAAFRFLKNNYSCAIQIDNTVLLWDTMQDFKYGTLTAREYDGMNCKEFSWSFEGCKDNYYKIYKGVA